MKHINIEEVEYLQDRIASTVKRLTELPQHPKYAQEKNTLLKRRSKLETELDDLLRG